MKANKILDIDDNYNALLCTYEQCRAYTKIYAKSFYFSSFLLPREKRNAAYSIYTFCRLTDNIADLNSHQDISICEKKFNLLEDFIMRLYNSSAADNEKSSAFADTLRKYKIPAKYLIELIEGVKMDLSKSRYETFAELECYCYKVASVVGLIMTEIFGYSNKSALRYAVYLGKAMQLTNILRDIGEDYKMNRIYIPQEELDCFEYSEKDIENSVVNPNFKMLMKFSIDRARTYYELASHGIKYLTDDGSRTTVVLMMKTYSAILDEIENHDYDVYSSRRYVNLLDKFRMTASYLLNPSEKRKFSTPESLNLESH
jgi:phytoene synthase